MRLVEGGQSIAAAARTLGVVDQTLFNWVKAHRSGKLTYIATDEGWLFLAVVINLFSRQVIGWSLRRDMTRDIVIDALRMAWFKRHPSKHGGLIFRSDRGNQYASKDYRDVLTEYGTRPQ